MQESRAANTASQERLPLAIVHGEPMTTLPKDLYIPPEALEVILEAFQGPLDLLLYLIKRRNLDILDIPIAEITRQYIEYIELMRDLRLEIAAEYLVMAAILAEIKSRLLLPRPVEEADEEDPRAELVRRLQEYERFKGAAQDLDRIPRLGRDLFETQITPPDLALAKVLPDIALRELISAFRDVVDRAALHSHHNIARESLSVRERMSEVLSALRGREFTEFTALCGPEEGRLGVVVTLLAVLELIKESLVEVVQSKPFAPLYLKTSAGEA